MIVAAIIYGFGTAFFLLMAVVLLTMKMPGWKALALAVGWPVVVPFWFLDGKLMIEGVNTMNTLASILCKGECGSAFAVDLSPAYSKFHEQRDARIAELEREKLC